MFHLCSSEENETANIHRSSVYPVISSVVIPASFAKMVVPSGQLAYVQWIGYVVLKVLGSQVVGSVKVPGCLVRTGHLLFHALPHSQFQRKKL